MEACYVWMLNGEKKGLLGTRQKRSHGLDVPSLMSILFLSPSPQKQTGWRTVAVQSSSALQFLRVPQSSPPLLRYWWSYCAETDESGVRSFGLGRGGRGRGCTHSEPVLDPSMEANRNTNKLQTQSQSSSVEEL